MFLQLWRRLRDGTRLSRQQLDWPPFVGDDWLDSIMARPATDRLVAKQGRTIGRLVLSHSGTRLVVYLKRNYRLPRLSGLLAALFPSRSWSPAFQEWDNLERLHDDGFRVPRPVAAAQYVLPGGRLQSVLAVEELTGMLALDEAIPLAHARLRPGEFDSWKRGLTTALADICRRLHERGFFHKDLYLCHFFIPESFTLRAPASWDDQVVMIDLHRLARHRFGQFWWLGKDLGQLLFSSKVEGVTDDDRALFWERYHGDGVHHLRTRLLHWIIHKRAANYHAKNASKRTKDSERTNEDRRAA